MKQILQSLPRTRAMAAIWSFLILLIPAGADEVQACPSFVSSRNIAEMALHNEELARELQVCSGTIRGVIRDQHGDPVTAGSIRLFREGPVRRIQHTHENPHGGFEVSGVPCGEYSILFEPADTDRYVSPYENQDYPLRKVTATSSVTSSDIVQITVSRYTHFFARGEWAEESVPTPLIWVLHHGLGDVQTVREHMKTGEFTAKNRFNHRLKRTFIDDSGEEMVAFSFKGDELARILKNGGGIISIHRNDDARTIVASTFISDLSQNASQATRIRLEK